jgi:methionyl-tRNA formyltransferase
MRIAYLGTSEFAAGILRVLTDSSQPPALVVTRPDRPRGRGRRVAAPPVALAAVELGLPLAQPASVNDEDARAQLAATAPDALVVCAFGALIKEPLLSDYEVLNVHPSLLPRWRGAAPIERAIMAGDAQTGVCIMRLTAGLDTGPVARRGSIEIAADDTFATLSQRLQGLAGELLLDALAAGLGGLDFIEQSQAGVTYAEKIAPEDRILTGEEDADTAARRVRALTPHIGAAVTLSDDTRLGVRAAHARPADAENGDPSPGEVGFDGVAPVLGCAGQTVLVLDEVQPAGGKAMKGAAYLRGRRS